MISIVMNVLNVKSHSEVSKLNNLVEWFGTIASDRQFLLIARESQKDLFAAPPGNFEFQFYKYPSHHSNTDNIWFEDLLKARLANIDYDLMFEFDGPVSLDFDCPKVSLVGANDFVGLGGDLDEGSFQKSKLKFIRKAEPENRTRTDGVIFPSQLIQRKISNRLKDARLKTTAIYLGGPEIAQLNKERVLSQYGIKETFLTAVVSSTRPKEISSILESFSRAFGDDENIPDLVLVGTDDDPGDVSKILKTISSVPNAEVIKYIGNVSNEILSALLKKTNSLILPVETELTTEILVTALKCGCAIVCSNRGALPEIADRAALYFDTRNISDLAFKLKLLFEDSDLNLFLRNQALERSKYFSWRNIAARMISFFDDILQDQEKPAKIIENIQGP